MSRTILIPIDFTVSSLNTLKLVSRQHKSEQVHVVLMYAEHLSSSISELLYYSPSKRIQSLAGPLFTDAIDIIRNSNETGLLSVKIELFHGMNVRAFNHFAEAHGIDLAYLPKSYRLQIRKQGFDPCKLIKASGLPVHEIEWPTDLSAPEADGFNALF